jgi:hypothetical protein
VTKRLRLLALLFLLPSLGGVPGAVRAQGGAPISQDDLRRWLSHLASDDLQGRQVFTEGLGLAATYIADHLQEWGVAPAGDDGTYFQTVKVLGMRTRSASRVTVRIGDRVRTFADGEGVTFPRNQGGKQTIAGPLEFVGYGFQFAPLDIDDYAGRSMAGKVAVYVGRRAPGMTATHNRLTNARARLATDTMGALAAIGPVLPPAGGGRGGGAAPAAGQTQAAAASRVDFQTAQRVDLPVAPLLTAGDEFFEFVFAGSGHSYADVKAKAERQEALPRIDLPAASIEIVIDAEYDVVQTRLSRNIVGVVAGGDPAASDTYVLLGAHYDHAGYQQFAGTVAAGPNAIASCVGQTRPAPRPGDIVNNGADDNGSGTVGLMALAKAFATGPRPRRSVLFVWHTGEEAGLWGSRYMADHLPVPPERIAAHLNMDMVGRNRCDDPAESSTVYLVGSDRISTELHNINEATNAELAAPLTLNYEYNDVADLESLYTRSDHYPYAAQGIPAIFFTTALHRDYHFATDEVEKIHFDKLARVAGLVYATAARVANLDHLPSRDRRGPRMGLGRTGRIP